MKRVQWIFLSILMLYFLAVPVQAALPEPEEITAEAAILMDADSGQVLYEKNADSRMYPASITKILTAMIVLEELSPDQILVASEAAVDLPSWSSSAGIQAGEQLSVDQALYALMLRSANEAANVLAEEVAGTQEAFAANMNTRAEELGAKSTHFTNAHGLSGRGHYTTAFDMALITRQALKTPGFSTYFGTDTYTMEKTNLSGAKVWNYTHRMLLQGYSQYNRDVIGGKTGYTVPAGYTLVTAAKQDERLLICVVMKSDAMYADTQALLDFGFEEFTPLVYSIKEHLPKPATILDGVQEVGRVSFSVPQAAILLLHQEIDPSHIIESNNLQSAYSVGDAIEGAISLRLEDGAHPAGLPDILLEIPLTVDVVMVDFPVEEIAVVSDRRAGDSVVKPRNFSILPYVYGTIPLLLISGVVLYTHIQKRRRRRRRMRRFRYRIHT